MKQSSTPSQPAPHQDTTHNQPTPHRDTTTPSASPANKPASVTIPKTALGARLDEAVAIQREMTELLRELEQTATGQSVTKPGAWRHQPPK